MIFLDSPSKHGIYQIVRNSKGKEVKELIWEKCRIINSNTGEIISSSILPKFDGYSYYDDFYADFANDKQIRFLETMSALEKEEVEDSEEFIAEKKLDGHRCTLTIGDFCNRAFSKRISKKTNWYNENSDQVPHIRDLALPELQGTILDGEMVWGKDSTECQSVMGALPSTAINNQAINNKFACLTCFDILYYKHVNIQKMPLIKRKQYLHSVIAFIQKKYNIDFINESDIFALRSNFKALTEQSVGRVKKIYSFNDFFISYTETGGEGIIVKDLNAPYMQGKHSPYYTKLKKHSTWDCLIIGISEPERSYEGKLIEEDRLAEWKYWEYPESDSILILEDGELADYDTQMICDPVTKPYAMGWCGGIRFGVWKPLTKEQRTHYEDDKEDWKIAKINGTVMEKDGVKYTLTEVGTAKGLTEELMQDLADNWGDYVKGKRVVEIMADKILDKAKGSLRHPRFYRWRDDKDHRACTWEKHIR